jgi:hypothetical protein
LAIILTLLYSLKIGILKITFLLQTITSINKPFKPLNWTMAHKYSGHALMIPGTVNHNQSGVVDEQAVYFAG